MPIGKRLEVQDLLPGRCVLVETAFRLRAMGEDDVAVDTLALCVFVHCD
ncbi:hypothetical protein [Aliiruegeria lutimaris]|nr:hypothetical protein [Aliiruegeria lutimaris]